MGKRWIGAAPVAALGLIAGVMAAGPLAAQQGSGAGAAAQSDPALSSEDQLAPSQLKQKVPAAVAEPTGGSNTTAHPATHAAAAAAAHPAEPKMPPPGAHVVACTGIFSKEFEPSSARHDVRL